MFRFNSLLHLSRHNIAIIGNGGFAREIACNLKKDSYKFYINKNFITKENINTVSAIEDIDFNNLVKMIISVLTSSIDFLYFSNSALCL